MTIIDAPTHLVRPVGPCRRSAAGLGKMPTLDIPSLSVLGDDLLTTSATRRMWTLSRPILWTGAYFYFAHRGWWLFAVAVFPALFLSQVVALNDVMHRSIGLSPIASEIGVALLGALVLESGHAIRVTHLAHHDQGGGAGDPESYVDLLPPRRLILELPLYRVRIWSFGWRHATRRERTVAALEFLFAALVGALCVSGRLPMSVTAYALLSVLAAWAFPLGSALGPHADWGRDDTTHAYRVRGRWVPWLMLNLPFHLEHHLYTEVPSHRLPELSARLAPYLERSGVKEVRTW
jgi:fatty acid desaturase